LKPSESGELGRSEYPRRCVRILAAALESERRVLPLPVAGYLFKVQAAARACFVCRLKSATKCIWRDAGTRGPNQAPGVQQAAKNLDLRSALKGHGFIRAE
jgi:hypothetical protein